MTTGKKLLVGGAAVLFASWAYFQLNDPDVLPWIVLYVGTAVACVWLLLRPLPVWIPAVLGVAALGWASWIAVDVALTEGFGFTFAHFLEEEAGERAREMLGLLITASWNGYLVRTVWRVRQRASA